MQEQAKRVADSKTEQVHILMPADINGANRLFGGTLMQWIDIVAAVVARRHANCDVTTAAVDRLTFHSPAKMNDTILLVGCITYVGRTSMEVKVDTYVEALDGTRSLVNHAHMAMVAVDSTGCPRPVPRLLLETAEEQAEWDAAAARHQERRQLRDSAKKIIDSHLTV